MLFFYHSVEHELAPNDDLKNQISIKLQKLSESHSNRSNNISDDEFDTISNWYNLPLLELGDKKDFELTAESGAGHLGIPVDEARLGLGAMTRLGFLKKIGNSYKKLKSVVTTTEVSSLAIKSFHRQMIAKAQSAIIQQNVKKRYLSGVTFKVSPEKLDEIKKMIDEHEKRVLEFAESCQDYSGQVLYQMNTQLFSLRQEDNE